MLLNSSKLFQKLTLIVLGIFLFLIVFENIYNQFFDTQNGVEVEVNHVASISSILNCKSIATQRSSQTHRARKTDSDNNGNSQTTIDDSQTTEAAAIVLWWTPFIDELEYTKNCGDSVCFFTGNRNYLDHEKLKTLLFYGSNMDVGSLPLPRKKDQIWALLHEESPKNVPLLLYQPALALFNLTATFSQSSDFPLTLQYLESQDKLMDRQYFVDVEEKNRLQRDEELAPVLYIQSICDTMSDRDAYVSELMKYIAIDSYGKCLNNNRNFPKSLTGEDYLSTLQTDEFYKFIARYKFVIAYENSVCDDYITEKLWRPLALGVVPIYFGAPNIQSWLPNNESAILIEKFEGPKQLADHIRLLNNNDEKYNRLLTHKLGKNFTNEKLQEELQRRGYETNSIVEDFECFICQKSIGKSGKSAEVVEQPKQLKDMCPKHLNYPKMRTKSDKRETWQTVFRQGKCEAEVLSEYVQKNRNFSKDSFQKELLRRYDDHLCGL